MLSLTKGKSQANRARLSIEVMIMQALRRAKQF